MANEIKEKSVKSWKQLDVRLLQKTKVFDLYLQRLCSPSGSYEDDFYFIKVVDWVNIIPITRDNEVVMVEQFRFGVHQPSLEIPGGMLDGPEDTPAEAAARELQEETGYSAESLEQIGMVYPNPAIQTNRCFTYLAREAMLTAQQALDAAEDIVVHLVPLADIPKLINEGRITHSLVVAAFFNFFASESAFFKRAVL